MACGAKTSWTPRVGYIAVTHCVHCASPLSLADRERRDKKQVGDSFMARISFRAPIPEIYVCAELLRTAVDAHIAGDGLSASGLISQANNCVVREWLDSIWGKASPYVNFRAVPNSPPILKKPQCVESRMPGNTVKVELLERDGFHCRFCGIPVIRREVRQYLHSVYPDALSWGRTNGSQHAAFQALWVQYDHILPHARGGTNALDNMVIACAACNFGRMDFTLEEVGIEDPRRRPIKDSDWNGLEHVLPSSKQVRTQRS